jgi:RimJ/RimL family protein N-acetyltransferase
VNQGVGTAARAGLLHFAGACCGASVARSHVLSDNLPSLAVSEKLGYREVARKHFAEDGRTMTEIVVEVPLSGWRSPYPVVVHRRPPEGSATSADPSN